MPRQMHLGLFIYPAGHHIAGWRHPAVDASSIAGIDYYRPPRRPRNAANSTCSSSATCWQRAKKMAAWCARAGWSNIDLDLDHFGIVGGDRMPSGWWRRYPPPIMSVLYRGTLSSLDHISNGRAGWNIVTARMMMPPTTRPEDPAMEKSRRYERAKEYVDICAELSDGRAIDHRGQFFTVKGAVGAAAATAPPDGR